MHTFKKEERLCNRRLINELFHNGSSFLCYPFKVQWLLANEPLPAPVQVMFSVAKKRYKRAVDRNLLKRRMRETYRLQKQLNLYTQLLAADRTILLSLGYIGKEIATVELMEKKMRKLLQQLCEGFAQ